MGYSKTKGDKQMEIVIINPGLIVGPHLNGGQFGSADIIKNFMMGEY